VRRLFQKALIFVLALGLASGMALAHSRMSKSHPSDGGTVAAGIEKVVLGFSKRVRVTVVKIQGDDQTQVPATLQSNGFVESVEVGVPPLKAGSYQVDWTGVAKDGHVMTGSLSFTVTP